MEQHPVIGSRYKAHETHGEKKEMQLSQPIIRVPDLTWIEQCPGHSWLETHGDPDAQGR
jgi:hypothetical protein